MNQLPIPTKDNFWEKIKRKFKKIFHKETIETNYSYNLSNDFKNSIQITVNSEIFSLKAKLDSGEIKAIDLTDYQIDALQKIYDEEILAKKQKLKQLKGGL